MVSDSSAILYLPRFVGSRSKSSFASPLNLARRRETRSVPWSCHFERVRCLVAARSTACRRRGRYPCGRLLTLAQLEGVSWAMTAVGLVC